MRLHSSFTFFLPILGFHVAFALVTDHPWWEAYNKCAWPALNKAVPPSCDQAPSYSTVTCLCNSYSFLTTAAKGIWEACGCAVLANSAEVAQGICKGESLNIAVTPSEFIAAGSSSCPTPTPSATPTTSSDANNGGGGAGLSAGTVAVISVISSLATIVGVGVGIWYQWRKKRRSQKEAAQKEAAQKLEQGSMDSAGSGTLTLTPSGASNGSAANAPPVAAASPTS